MKYGVDIEKVTHSYEGTMNIDEKVILPGDIDNPPLMDAVRAENKRIDDEIYEICEGIAVVVGFGRCYFIDRKNVADALRKQIPTEVLKKKKPDRDFYVSCCPRCYAELGQAHLIAKVKPYCQHCGQKLDWGLEDDRV